MSVLYCSKQTTAPRFIGPQNRSKNHQVNVYVALKEYGWEAGENLLSFVIWLHAVLSLNSLKVTDFPTLKTNYVLGRKTCGILNGVLPTATLSNTQTSSMNNNNWKLVKIKGAHASHSWNFGAQLGQQLRNCRNWEGERGVRAAGYFKEPAQDDGEVQDCFQ